MKKPNQVADASMASVGTEAKASISDKSHSRSGPFVPHSLTKMLRPWRQAAREALQVEANRR